MDENNIQSQKHKSVAEQNTREKTNIAENAHRDYLGDLFTFRNVLFFAIILGILILIFSRS